jgi:hypothetical protein
MVEVHPHVRVGPRTNQCCYRCSQHGQRNVWLEIDRTIGCK